MSQSVADGLDADTGREWSDAELTELGNMLVRGLSIEEIAQLLRRDHRQGPRQSRRGRRGLPCVCFTNSEPARVLRIGNFCLGHCARNS
jgi:hypothetical protein